jgi:hypothetical protein
MVNSIAPAAIILVNNDLTDNVKSAVQRQLFINETVTGSEFDARLEVNPNYTDVIHNSGLRLLIVRPFTELTNRSSADIVIFIKAGLASVLVNKFGPPGKTYAVDRMYLSQLIHTS